MLFCAYSGFANLSGRDRKCEQYLVCRFLELKQYILEKRDELVKTAPQPVSSGGGEKSKAKGFGSK